MTNDITIQIILSLLKEKQKNQKELTDYLGITQNAFTDWKSGRIKSYRKHLSKIAEFFDVSVDYLLGKEETKKAPVSPAVTTEDEELIEYLEELRSRPEMRMLFSLSKNATKEDVEDAVRIIEALRKGRQS